MANTIIFGQQKGGVGKTTDTCMITLVAAMLMKKRTILIDIDLQANATNFMTKTFGVETVPQTLMSALENGDLRPAIVNLKENLDLIPAGYDMRLYTEFLTENFDNTIDRTFYLKNLIEEIKDDYDYIFIDIPPSTDLKVDNAMVACDYLVVVQETQQFSFEGSQRLIFDYIQTLVDDFGSDVPIQIAGILPALLQQKRPMHQKLVEETIDTFGRDNVFNTIIQNHARLEWYPRIGFQFQDYHDKKMIALFADIFCELEERITLYKSNGDIQDYFYTPRYILDGKLTSLGKEISLNV
ncbi:MULTISPECIES: ParA superfamily DNA segregation protein PrgP [Bacilli]|jgi:chromosome partitioning protein|uniref:ParA superfamily DNA segregation protein PrgP n=7 Tax=Enterococcus TaxID=1350 RepID=A0AAU9ASJ1_ENTFL|nr:MULTISPECIES: ParA superfamily DNA segregation protein PrgP [Bacilli]MDU4982520.1 ParA superfamily DNA segregation protein PrgP [Campylobacter ureolyticus]MDU7800174.1 ParA superfamily DNA segregation protein PrgP [Clostridioides difficile]APE41935.1 chromosome partitioning protein ParA [Enterococcus faecium]EHR4740563.1 AAA family ATPase [Enterococcus faecalis]EIB6793410.1 AAA family ATPase [Enterococcus faecalis]